MKEDEHARRIRGANARDRLGWTCRNQRRSQMTLTRYAFVKAQWHADIVDQALVGFQELIPPAQVDVFDVPGAFEMPLIARDLAMTGRYGAVACAAFVVDGGIYRHDFVAQAVVDGLMRAGLDSGVPVLSVSLTPHQYQETDHHNAIYQAHFVEKGREAARAALAVGKTRSRIAA
ncbi:6,7-dimethyl-8-ribityllumazine synthase [Rhodobacteraceae bacterium F11138]|nr:6,7-dimethyl-8-ribityllumazine synthase [Rhodobacteraceae bacterium F11138]